MTALSVRKRLTALAPARLALFAAAAGLGLVHAPGQATARSGAYSASLATPLSQPRQEIIGGILWKCADERCSAPAGGSRAVLVCERVARAFGAVARFSAPSGELSADELARCNAAR